MTIKTLYSNCKIVIYIAYNSKNEDEILYRAPIVSKEVILGLSVLIWQWQAIRGNKWKYYITL